MEDEKLADYYDELKAAAPKGGRGGLGAIKGSFSGGFGKRKAKASGKAAGTNGAGRPTLLRTATCSGSNILPCSAVQYVRERRCEWLSGVG